MKKICLLWCVLAASSWLIFTATGYGWWGVVEDGPNPRSLSLGLFHIVGIFSPLLYKLFQDCE